MSKDSSGPNPTLSSHTGIRLTIPELLAVVAVVATAVLGWARLDGRLSRLEDAWLISGRVASQPILVNPKGHP